MRTDRKHQPVVLASIAKRIQQNRRAQWVEAHPSEFLWNRQPGQAHFPAFTPQVAVERLLPVPGGSTLTRHPFAEPNDLVSKLLLLLRECEIHQTAVSRRW